MKRLTDRKTAAELNENAKKLRAAGLEPTISDLRYIKLAAYENRDEQRMSERLLSYQLPGYAIDEDLQDETKWTKEYPALTPFMKRKIRYEKPKLYLCNADKRLQCRGTECYKNGGYCRLTAHKEFAQTDENGNEIEYEEG